MSSLRFIAGYIRRAQQPFIRSFPVDIKRQVFSARALVVVVLVVLGLSLSSCAIWDTMANLGPDLELLTLDEQMWQAASSEEPARARPTLNTLQTTSARKPSAQTPNALKRTYVGEQKTLAAKRMCQRVPNTAVTTTPVRATIVSIEPCASTERTLLNTRETGSKCAHIDLLKY
jgi:hypothetical protein